MKDEYPFIVHRSSFVVSSIHPSSFILQIEFTTISN